MADSVAAVLTQAGYKRMSDPFNIGRVKFDDLRGYLGPEGSLDIVLVLNEPSRALLQVERVCRALDAAGSRRPVTAVLGPRRVAPSLLESMTRYCRVLVVDPEYIRESLATLLPLELPPAQTDSQDTRTLATILKINRTDPLHPIVAASGRGAEAVHRAYMHWVDSAFDGTDE